MEKKNTKKMIATLKRFAPRRATMPILSYALVSNGGIMATDLSNFISINRRQDDQPLCGKGCARVEDLERILAGTTEILTNGMIKTTSGDIVGVSAEEYPDAHFGSYSLDKMEISQAINDPELVWSKIEAVNYASSKDEARYNLNGVCLRGKELLATDGHRLAIYELRNRYEGSAIIPNYFIRALKGCEIKSMSIIHEKKGGYTGWIEVTGYTGGYAFRASARLLDAVFPDCSLVKQSTMFRGEIHHKQITPHLEACIDLIRDKTKGTKFVINGAIEISARDIERGEYKATAPYMSNDLPPLTVGFNARYILEALEVSDSATSKLYADNASDAAVIMTGDIKSVIMPMRL
jgi:DNA polymerase III sliding clamp (beta) subunit (PCNA family)